MSHRHRYGEGHEMPLGAAVSDCAPVSRGAATRLPLRLPERPGKLAGEQSKCQLDSGLDSGYLSQTFGTDECLSQRSLAAGPPEPAASCPKEASARLDSGVDLGGLLTSELDELRLDEQRLDGQSLPDEQERARWQERYFATLKEAYVGDEDGDTHLHLAIIYGFGNISEGLIRLVPHPNFLNLRNNYMQTPLHLAVLTGDDCLCRRLLVAGADPGWRDRHGNTPLHVACQRADRASVHALTEPVTAQEVQQAAARYPCQPVVASSAQLDEWNYQGLSCLHLAVLSRDQQITAHLICHGANVNVLEGKSGRTPLHLAAEAGDIAMLRLLVEACGADVNATTYSGLSSYQLALLNGRMDVAELLLQLGAGRRSLPDSDMDSSSDSDPENLVKPEDIYSDFRIRGQPLATALVTAQ